MIEKIIVSPRNPSYNNFTPFLHKFETLPT